LKEGRFFRDAKDRDAFLDRLGGILLASQQIAICPGFAVAVFFLPIPSFGQFALFCYESGIQAMNKLSQETSSGPFH